MSEETSARLEECLLGSILLKSKMYNAVCGIVVCSDFTSPRNKLIYQTMQELALKEQAIDTLTVSNLLSEKGLLETAGCVSYISALADSVPSAMHAVTYAEEIRDKSIDREYLDVLKLPETIEATMARLDELARRKRNTNEDKTEMIYENGVARLEQRIAKGTIKAMKTGHGHLDDVLGGGFIRGCYYLISGVTGSGKSRLAVDWSVGLVKHGASVLYVTLELPLSDIEAMYVANRYTKVYERDIDFNKFNKGQLDKTMMEDIYANLEFEKDKFAIRQHIQSGKPMLPGEIEIEIEERKKITPIDIVIVDYVTLLTLPGYGKQAFELSKMYAAISRKMNDIALKHSVAMIALAQTSIPKRGEEGFELGDMAKSKEMMECAWFVAGIVRNKTAHEVGLHIAKNRFGGLDKIQGNLIWNINTWKLISSAETKEETKQETDEHPF